MKKAFLVVGAEDSGTKMVTQILANHGCHGQNVIVDNEQAVLNAIEKKLPLESDPIVVRLSMPHGGQWYDIENFIWTLRCMGYQTTTIVTVRDWVANMRSQCNDQTHAFTHEHSVYKLQKAYKMIFAGLSAVTTDFFMVTYESIMMEPKEIMHWIVWRCGLNYDEAKCPEIHNANKKWYK